MDNNPLRMFGEMFAEVFTPPALRQRQEEILARLALGAEGDKLALAQDWNALGKDFDSVINTSEPSRADDEAALDNKEEE